MMMMMKLKGSIRRSAFYVRFEAFMAVTMKNISHKTAIFGVVSACRLQTGIFDTETTAPDGKVRRECVCVCDDLERI
jgi:hypothetical protein